MKDQTSLKAANIEISGSELRIGSSKYDLTSVTHVNILQQTPVKDAGKALFAIGVIATIFGSRWFLAGGVFFILLSLVSLFDTSKKLSVALVTNEGDKTVFASYESKLVYALSKAIEEEIEKD